MTVAPRETATPARVGVERLGWRLWRVRTREGRLLRLRPIRPEDAEPLQRAFDREDPEDRRMRLLTVLPRLPLPFATRLCTCDESRDVCLVYEAEDEPGELLGGARLMRDRAFPGKPDDRAEFAVSMASDLKGQGLAKAAFAIAIQVGREIGIRRIWGLYDRQNKAMRGLAQRFDLEERTDPEDPALLIGEGVIDDWGRSLAPAPIPR